MSFTLDPAILEEMAGRAAVYRPDIPAVLLNPRYFRYLQDLERFYDEVGESAERRALAKDYFDAQYAFHAGCFVIQAWLNHDQQWFTQSDFEQALSMGSLTATLASPQALIRARKKYHDKMGPGKKRGVNDEAR